MRTALDGDLAVIFDRIGPYHFARLRALGQAVPTTAIEITALDQTYGWDLVTGAEHFKRVTLFPAPEDSTKLNAEVSRRVRAALDQCRPAAVAVPGWSDPGALSALQWCAERRVPAIVMSDSTEWDHPRVFWKEWIKRRLLRLASAALVAGTPHADYLKRLGMAPDQIFQGYDVVDNDYFAQGAREARQSGAQLREKHGLPENYFLASARFVEKKNLPRLIEAYAKYRDRATRHQPGSPATGIWHLVLLGDGPLRADLRNQVAALGLQNQVQMHGFQQYAELPVYYGLARAFVLASTTEQWGLVINEAMASDLPVLVSDRCGCAEDLVKDGVTGFRFDPARPEQLAEIFSRCSEQAGELAGMGAEGKRLIGGWGLDCFVRGLTGAASRAVRHPGRPGSVIDKLLIKMLLRRQAA